MKPVYNWLQKYFVHGSGTETAMIEDRASPTTLLNANVHWGDFSQFIETFTDAVENTWFLQCVSGMWSGALSVITPHRIFSPFSDPSVAALSLGNSLAMWPIFESYTDAVSFILIKNIIYDYSNVSI